MIRPTWKELVLLLAVISVGVGLRMVFLETPNVAPVAALALWSGYYFRSRLMASLAPLIVMAVTDTLVVEGRYDWRLMVSVYGLLAASAWFGAQVRTWRREATSRASIATAIAGASLLSSLIFFFGTNTMVWWTSPLYTSDFAGLIACWTQGIPFFRNTLVGDLGFTCFFFGGTLLWSQSLSWLLASSSAIPAPERN